MAKPVSRRKLLKSVFFGGLALGGLDAIAVEPRWLDVTQVSIPIRGLGPALDGYRIALLADFHLPASSRHLVHKALASANAFSPDLIAMPGDFVDSHGRPLQALPVPDLTGYFDSAQAPDGVVGTLGNHDHWLNASGVKEQLRKNTPIRLIESEHIMVERGRDRLAVGGIGDLWNWPIEPERTFADVPEDVPRILLSHNPDFAEEMTQDIRVDLQLSGHTHGGQVRIPFGPAPMIPSRYGQKFRAGLCDGKHHRVYVTRGVVSMHHVRFWCRPEVTCITLRSA